MPNRRIKTSLYVFGLAISLASALPTARHHASSTTASATTEVGEVDNSALQATHKIEIHGTHHTERNAIENQSLEKDTDDDATDKTRPISDLPPTVDISIKKGGGGANTRGSSVSYTDSSGISYDRTGHVVYIPLGGANSIFIPLGGVFDVPGWNSASMLDASVVMARVIALSVTTGLAIYWTL
ncbi:hypothetical protein FHL15_004979 [Xylaria flabelliformis]|uniref:Uncharacterized protein n=1 Tax=Xylaria flabelliformis TaxID=2512241 RepID=A0A553I1Y5_9PEZI|nr:hypothetical protein FHL15_004979 [Xylaria flabelliformis]